MERQRTAIVTGASSGFGMLTASVLAHRGWKVAASYRKEAKLRKVKSLTHAVKHNVEFIRMDITDVDQTKAALEEVKKNFGTIDALVNNAGYAIGGFFYDVNKSEQRNQLETNVFGTFNVTKNVLPHMLEQGQGHIVTVSSISGIVPLPGLGAYAASKFAIEGMMESLRHELWERNIMVTLLEPGTYKTEIFFKNKRLAAATDDPNSPFYETFKRLNEFSDAQVQNHGRDPLEVATKIADILDKRSKKLRHVVGPDAKLEYALRKLLPARSFEFLLRKYLFSRQGKN